MNPTGVRSSHLCECEAGGKRMGDLAIQWRMWLFYLWVEVQRLFAFSPRLSFAERINRCLSPARNRDVLTVTLLSRRCPDTVRNHQRSRRSDE